MARILIADDDAHIARVLGLWLERHGHQVTMVGNGAVALKAVERESFDLIISDMNMPVLDGLGLVRAVRTKIESDVPIVVLTARCDQENLMQELAKFGAKVYPKPFLPSQLVVEMNQLLGTATA